MAYEHRRAEAVVRALDSAGRPMANRTLRVEQQTQDFWYGCGAFDAIPCANDGQDDPFWRDRMEKWLNLFNYGTLPFSWGQYEPEEDAPRYEILMNAARFLV